MEKDKKRIYCAAYCRKSVEERSDETFGSIENQNEAILSFIESHKHEGWVALSEKYDDNGFTGSNIDRPSLQKLISDIKDGKVNMVIVYKLDRLSRSLIDFVQLLKFFEKYNVSFASVTQPIDTSSSTGKLMLHILSSFAEFERQLISERTKDKMSAARKRGQWTGGWAALGYDVDKVNKKLVINPTEEKLIKEIFDLYLKGNSLLRVAQILNDKGYRSKSITLQSGKTFGNKKFGITHIQSTIKNPLYIGKVRYAGQIYEGEQEAIIDEETFKKAQEMLKENRVERKATKNTDCSSLLTHLLHCKACGTFMIHTYTLKNKTHRYRYYICSNAQKRGYIACPTKSINAQAIEDATINYLKEIFNDNQNKRDNKNKQEIEALLSPIWDTLYPQEKRRIIKALVKEVDYSADTKKLGLMLTCSDLRHEFDVDLKQVRPLNKWHKEIEIEKEPKIRKSLILAYQLQKLLDEDKVTSLKQASEWLNISQSRLNHMLTLLLLSPTIQTEILNGDNKVMDLIPEYKIRSLASHFDWNEQASIWKNIKA